MYFISASSLVGDIPETGSCSTRLEIAASANGILPKCFSFTSSGCIHRPVGISGTFPIQFSVLVFFGVIPILFVGEFEDSRSTAQFPSADPVFFDFSCSTNSIFSTIDSFTGILVVCSHVWCRHSSGIFYKIVVIWFELCSSIIFVGLDKFSDGTGIWSARSESITKDSLSRQTSANRIHRRIFRWR